MAHFTDSLDQPFGIWFESLSYSCEGVSHFTPSGFKGLGTLFSTLISSDLTTVLVTVHFLGRGGGYWKGPETGAAFLSAAGDVCEYGRGLMASTLRFLGTLGGFCTLCKSWGGPCWVFLVGISCCSSTSTITSMCTRACVSKLHC